MVAIKPAPYPLAVLREFLDYSPETGEFRWRAGVRAASIGRPAGSINKDGRLMISVKGGRFASGARLAWYMHYGVWPDAMVDHIDRNPRNNAIANLRLADAVKNQYNRVSQKNSKTGVKGVHAARDGYRVSLQANGRRYYRGPFPTIEEAVSAHADLSALYHGDFAPTAVDSDP